MNIAQAQQMTPKKKNKELGRLFNLHRESLRQALQALESRKPKIAVSVLDGLAETRANIETLMSEGQYSPSVHVKLKELLTQQRRFSSAFAAAIRTGSISEVKNILNWLDNVDLELAVLV